jgi:hypothetical protein
LPDDTHVVIGIDGLLCFTVRALQVGQLLAEAVSVLLFVLQFRFKIAQSVL